MDELNRINVEQFQQAPKIPVFIILDNVRSLHNIGSIFRTSDAFRIEKLFLCGITATPPHRDIHKSALGSTESVEWEYYSDSSEITKKLKADNVEIFAIEQTDKSILLNNFTIKRHKKNAYVFGNEVNGVSDEVLSLCDFSLEIPQFGTKHSFNVAVSAGIVLWKDFVDRMM